MTFTGRFFLQGGSPAENAIDAHLQDFVGNEELLIPILKAFAQCTRSLHATPNALCFQSVSISRTACHSHWQQPGSPSTASSAPHRTTHICPTAGIITSSVDCNYKQLCPLEANSPTATQEISCILRNLKIHYLSHNNSPMDS